MENKINLTPEKKYNNKARSYENGFQVKNKAGQVKGKFIKNGAARSLDTPRDKSIKDNSTNEISDGVKYKSPVIQPRAPEGFLSGGRHNKFRCSVDNVSHASTDLSKYELLRNLSFSNCNSDEGCSGNTCSKHPSPVELTVKDEHLERYFRSAELWSNNSTCGDQGSALPNVTE
ncbi:hypothetical protein RR46_13097 [Papilio xuthus]|uniref:Uncharacterized protein n=1 Tax=Papilio xuthus TaxID=66420 RepID=A0A194PKS7_PAPXU|nr:hypothetical protein RR46_13097 [Papilio xuthus]